ncbi:hypothetical protein ACQCSX_04495 [Pseudarthrobacter sp. P1]|uniref:hypothetical protein n=1 Tax=Pseudarthrobacter sp. P1 TaxID=3418418 RepID=UPI003CF63B49
MAVETTPRLGLKKYTDGSDEHPDRASFNAGQDILEQFVAIAQKGDLVARPGAGIANRFFYDTTGKRLYFDDGAAWVDLNPNGGGGPGSAVVVAGTAVEGVSVRAARADHTHNLALATQTVAGALSVADKKKLDEASAAATPLTLVRLDAAGRAQVAAPAVAADIAPKSYVDGQVGTRALSTHAHDAGDVTTGVLAAARLPAATQTAAGALSAVDKKKLDAASSTPTANTLVMLDANGRTQIAAPSAAADAANKSYVDGQVGTRALADHNHDGSDLTSGTVPAARLPAATGSVQGAMSPADKAKLDAATALNTGSTVVMRTSGGDTAFRRVTAVDQPSAVDHLTRKDYVDTQVATKADADHTHAAADTTTGTFAPARLPAATQTAAGALSAVDKKKLDSASSSSAPSTLMMTDTNGRFQAAAPSGGSDVANKTYVDAQVAKLPTAMARGVITTGQISAGGGTGPKSITFPAGRFTTAPDVLLSSNNSRVSCSYASVTTTGATLTGSNWTTVASPADTEITWVAVQW